jgi:hypothetical protein
MPSLLAVVIIIDFSVSLFYTLQGNESKAIRWMWGGFFLLIGSGIVLFGWFVFIGIQGAYEATTL